MSEADNLSLAGVVAEMGPNLDCVVKLDSGAEVMARIPKRTARLMFQIVPGDRVVVEVRGAGGYTVLGHERVLR